MLPGACVAPGILRQVRAALARTALPPSGTFACTGARHASSSATAAAAAAASQSHAYALGSEARELVRLGIQHGVFAAESRALYRRAQVQLGDTVLDVGCGPGFSALELAQIVGPSGTVYGLDGSRASLRKLADRAREHGWVDADAPRRATPRPPPRLERLEHPDFGALELVEGDVCTDEVWQSLDGVQADKVWCRSAWMKPGTALPPTRTRAGAPCRRPSSIAVHALTAHGAPRAS